MKKILLTALALLSFCSINAQDDNVSADYNVVNVADVNDAILVWVNGSSTCYKLDSMPTLSYTSESVMLTLDGKTTPELTLPLTDTSELNIVFGNYDLSSIDSPEVETTKVTKNGKYISGGQLIIVKDGKQYKANGTRIKN